MRHLTWKKDLRSLRLAVNLTASRYLDCWFQMVVLLRSIQRYRLFCLSKQTRAVSEKDLKIPHVIVISGGFCIMQGGAVLIGKAGSVFLLGSQWGLIESNSHFICLVLLMKTKRGNTQWPHEMRWKLSLFWGKSVLKLVFKVQDVSLLQCLCGFISALSALCSTCFGLMHWKVLHFIKLDFKNYFSICLCFLLNLSTNILLFHWGIFRQTDQYKLVQAQCQTFTQFSPHILIGAHFFSQAYNIHVNGVLHCRVRYSQLLGLHEQVSLQPSQYSHHCRCALDQKWLVCMCGALKAV